MKTETPLVKLDSFENMTLYAKLENRNPSGTIKYRTAKNMIDNAISSGILKEGMTIIEHTSGNMGIAIAYIGKKLGYPVTIIGGKLLTPEAKDIIRKYGAKLVEVDGWFIDCEKRVKEIISKNPESYFWVQQGSNPNSLESNFNLGLEIANQFYEQYKSRIDVFLASMGTGSTITGVGKALKERNPKTKVYLVLPDGEYKYVGVDDKGESTVPMPLFNPNIADGEVRVKESEAIEAAKILHRDYGHYVGISAGADFAAAKKVSREEKGNAVIIFPDSGDRYKHVLGEE